jgi:hypothetical protein
MANGNDVADAYDGRMGQWAAGLSDGVVVTIEIRRWRGITMSLDDIIPDDSAKSVERKVNAILAGLLPREIDMKLRTAETQARGNLASHSFPCDAFEHMRGRFVPSGVYADFAARNERYHTEYDEAARMLEANYDAVAGGIIAGITGIVARECGTGSGSIVDAIVRMFPSHSDIADAMSYTTQIRRISRGITDSITSMGQCRAGEIELSDNAPATCLQAAGRHVTLAETRAMMSRDVKATMHNADIDRQSNAFMLDSAVQLRSMLADGCTRIVTSMDKNSGRLVGRSSIMAHNMVDTIRAMDYYGDAELQEVIGAIAYELDGREARDKDRLHAAFAESAEWARDSVSYLNGVTQRKPKLPEGAERVDGAQARHQRHSAHDDAAKETAREHTDASTRTPSAKPNTGRPARQMGKSRGGAHADTIVIPQRTKARR